MEHNLKIPSKYVPFFKKLFVNALLFSQFFPRVFYIAFAKMHYDMVRRFLNAKKKITMAMVPRGFGKTSIAIYILILFAGIFLRVRYILVIEETTDKADKSSRNLRSVVEKSSMFKEVFGDVVGKPWSNEECCFRSSLFGFEFFVGFTSILSGMRGLLTEEARPQIVIINDPEDQESEEIDASKVKRKITILTKTIIPMLQERDEFGRHGKIWWLATLIGPGCFCDQVSRWSNVEVVKYPALDESDRSTWEDMFSTERLVDLRQWYIDENRYADWLAEYMQEAEALERVDFPQPIPTFQLDEFDEEIPRVVFALDAAYSVSKSADPIGFSIGGYSPHKVYYILKAFEGKYPPEELYKKMSEVVKFFKKINYPIITIRIEAIAFSFVTYGARHSPWEADFRNILFAEAKHPAQSKVYRVTKNVLTRAISGNLLTEEKSTQVIDQMSRFPYRMKTWGAIDATSLAISSSMVPPLVSGVGRGVKPGTPQYVIQKKESEREKMYALFFKQKRRSLRR